VARPVTVNMPLYVGKRGGRAARVEKGFGRRRQQDGRLPYSWNARISATMETTRSVAVRAKAGYNRLLTSSWLKGRLPSCRSMNVKFAP
jgi:hypothetical protein